MAPNELAALAINLVLLKPRKLLLLEVCASQASARRRAACHPW
jgi:hypothetical protein